MTTDDWAYRFINPSINRVFVSQHYRTSSKYSIMLTEKQWKEWFPDVKYTFDYVNGIVRIK